MEINADFTQRVIVRFSETPWVASPSAGVERKMLDRIGGEVARATTIVRFAPGSAFSAHTHDGGEEYLVLEGRFDDETGAFPVGSYVRNPPTSRHTPAAPEGATILVKLHQFDPADREEVHGSFEAQGVLFENSEERVELVELAPGETMDRSETGGAEVFVIDGTVLAGTDRLDRWDWLRLPVGQPLRLDAGEAGARVWVKTGHLAARPPAAPASAA